MPLSLDRADELHRSHRSRVFAASMVARLSRAAARGIPLVVAVVAISLAVGLLSVLVHTVVLLAVLTVMALGIIAIRAPRLVTLVILTLLPFVGLLRRASGSYESSFDPILLVSPIVATACWFASIRRGDLALPTPLRRAVVILLVIAAFGAANPLQGDLGVGLVGSGLFVGPMIWFFVGQRLGDHKLLRLLQGVLILVSLIVAAYGLKQLLVGFYGFEQHWIDSKSADYHALNISGHIRPFATFASAAEYSYFLALGAILLACRRGLTRRILIIPLIGLLVLTCFFAGSRSIFVLSMAGVILVVVSERVHRLLVAFMVSVAVSLVGIAFLTVVPLSKGDTTAASAQNRTLQGLSDPFNSDVSTANIHIASVIRGTADGLRNPIGQGPAVTNAAGRGTVQVQSTEHDLPNALIAYGWFGGAAVIYLLICVCKLTARVVRKADTTLLGPTVFVFLLFGTWFVGGLYAVSALIWFFMGAVDRNIFLSDNEPVEAQSQDDRAGQPAIVAAT